MNNPSKVSLPVIKRLPKYYRYVSEMQQNGITKISSSELAKISVLLLAALVLSRSKDPLGPLGLLGRRNTKTS